MQNKLYYCDMTKNALCPKTHCVYLHADGECRMTQHKRFALNDDFVILEDLKSEKGLKPNRENIS